jgi:hypothetical protein
MSCAPPSGWAVAEWTVDVGPLVMKGQGSEIFSTGTVVSVSSYMEYGEGSLSLPDRVFELRIRRKACRVKRRIRLEL